jgi:hypothetical protein
MYSSRSVLRFIVWQKLCKQFPFVMWAALRPSPRQQNCIINSEEELAFSANHISLQTHAQKMVVGSYINSLYHRSLYGLISLVLEMKLLRQAFIVIYNWPKE